MTQGIDPYRGTEGLRGRGRRVRWRSAAGIEARRKIARTRAGVTKAQARAQRRYERLVAARKTNHMVDAGFHFYERDLGAGGGVLAGALAFRLFLFAVPYVFVVITIFGSAADLQNESGQDAARSAGLTGLIGKSVADAQHQTAARRSSASSSACSRSSSAPAPS